MAYIEAHYSSKSPGVLFDALANPDPIVLPGVGDSYHSYLNTLLDAFAGMDQQFVSELIGGRFLSEHMDASGVLRFETVGYSAVISPTYPGSIGANGSRVSAVKYVSKVDGSELEIRGLLSYTGAPLATGLIAGSTIVEMTASVPSQPQLGGLAVGNSMALSLVYQGAGWSGKLESFGEAIVLSASEIVGVGLAADISIGPSRSAPFHAQPGPIESFVLTQLDADLEITDSVTIAGFSISSQVLPLVTPQAMLLAGDDTVVMTGSGTGFIDTYGGNDLIFGGPGNDHVDGGLGHDIFVAEGLRHASTIARLPEKAFGLTGPGGADQLVNVERVLFQDLGLAFDIDGLAGQAYRLYKAAFNRVPDHEGLGYWIAELDGGARPLDVSAGFIGSGEFLALYGWAPSNADFTRALYRNVLQRDPDEAGYAYWNAMLENAPWNGTYYGQTTREQMLIDFAESLENKANVIGLIESGIEYMPWA